MKKPKLVRRLLNLCGAAVGACFISMLASCATIPEQQSVDLLSVVAQDAALYVHVPVGAYEDVARTLLRSSVEDMSEKDATRIVTRTRDVYAAVGEAGDVRLAASGSYPAAAIKSALSEKHGWKAASVDGVSGEYTYYAPVTMPRGKSALELAFTESGVVLASPNVQSLVKQYDALLYGAAFSSPLFDYVNEPVDDEIRFAAENPALVSKLLFGAKQDIGLTAISGSIKRSRTEENCSLSLSLTVADPRTIKATAALVKLAIFPVAAQIRVRDSNHIEITEYTMPWKKLYALFGR